MKYFKFYIDDFIIGTSFMSNEEIGTYIKMLCYQWDKGKLPNDKKILSKMFAGEVTDQIISKFSIDENNFLFNQRMMDEKNKADSKIEKLKANGLKGASKKWNQPEILPDIEPDKQMKFRIRDEKIYINPSEYIKSYHGSFIEVQLMQIKISPEVKISILSDVFSQFDSEYSFYDFSNQNHLKNAFKSILNKKVDELKGKKQKLSIHGSESFD